MGQHPAADRVPARRSRNRWWSPACASCSSCKGDERILDVGTGSGYHAAVLARLRRHVWSVERHAALSEQAAKNLARRGGGERDADRRRRHPRPAGGRDPVDAINVAAAAGAGIPAALESNSRSALASSSPVDDGDQRLVVVERTAKGLERRGLERVRFVPLVS